MNDLFDALPESEREEIALAVRTQYPNIGPNDHSWHRACVAEARRRHPEMPSPNGAVLATSDFDEYRFSSASDLLNAPVHAETWIVEGLFAEGGYSLLVSKPKAGKSTLASCLSMCVLRGTPFLGRPTKAGSVLYLALEEREDPAPEARRGGAGPVVSLPRFSGTGPGVLRMARMAGGAVAEVGGERR